MEQAMWRFEIGEGHFSGAGAAQPPPFLAQAPGEEDDDPESDLDDPDDDPDEELDSDTDNDLDDDSDEELDSDTDNDLDSDTDNDLDSDVGDDDDPDDPDDDPDDDDLAPHREVVRRSLEAFVNDALEGSGSHRGSFAMTVPEECLGFGALCVRDAAGNVVPLAEGYLRSTAAALHCVLIVSHSP